MDNLGLRLKQLRQSRGLSQRKLAQTANVSNATVSLIEHGRTDPSMGLLRKILDSLGVSFAEFFSSDTRTSERYFYSRDELSEIGSGPISYLQVGSDLSEGQLQILYERYSPGADTGQSMLSHDAEEGGIVLQGRLEVTVMRPSCWATVRTVSICCWISAAMSGPFRRTPRSQSTKW